MLVGIDDTDSPRGGCTTFVLTEVIRAATRLGWDLIGEPRLVRLNPNIPWKTRGNAALAAKFGRGRGAARTVGRWNDGPIRSFPSGTAVPPGETRKVVDALWEVVLSHSREGDERTDPALVAVHAPLPAELYWNAVRTVVPLEVVRRLLADAGAEVRSSGSGRGIIGAASATAWRGSHPTWELIAYREPGRAGVPRVVEGASVRAARRSHPSLFLCSDDRTRRLLVAPHTPCPILYGLRSTRPGPLFAARRMVRSEPVERWVVFRTNQGTGDHLTNAGAPASHSAVRVVGRVATRPEVLPGGHVRIALAVPRSPNVHCVVFEPTKSLAAAARGLWPGDRLRAWGGMGASPVVRLEGFDLLAAVPRLQLRSPQCPVCGRRMRSLGRTRGYRCRRCRSTVPPEGAVRVEISPRPPLGRYHPTPSARRHLHPLGPENDGLRRSATAK